MVGPGWTGYNDTIPILKTLCTHRMDSHPLPKKRSDHGHSQTEICLERKRIWFDWFQTFEKHIDCFTLKSFDKSLQQHSSLLGERVKNNENPFSFQMISSDNNMSQLELWRIYCPVSYSLNKKKSPRQVGGSFHGKRSLITRILLHVQHQWQFCKEQSPAAIRSPRYRV